MRRNAPRSQFAHLPVLDAMPPEIALVGAEIDLVGAQRGDPRNCAFAHTAQRADLDAIIYRTEAHIRMMATLALIRYNRERRRVVTGLRQGDLVLVRYINDGRLREQIRLFDDDGREFVPGRFTLLVPSYGNRLGRDKGNGGRRQRADSRAEGQPPRRRRVAQLTRVARVREAGLH